jgi:ferrochelatase
LAKTGVILLNLGGPDSPEAIRPFLYNLFSDREIIKLGLPFMQKPLACLISRLRAGKTRKTYGLIGGGSPILEITNAQASALEEALKRHGDFGVYVAMRYWHPFTEDAVVRADRDGVKRLIALSLYPQYSRATTGSSEARLWEIVRNYDMQYETVSEWYDHPLYIEAMVGAIKKELRDETHVLFSAHSLPVSFIEGGDPYVDQIMGTIGAITEKIDIKWSLGYQSRSGPVKWLEPSTDEALKRLAAEGVTDVLIVPISFVSDHVETLYEIDILYREFGEGLGLSVRRSESLNTNPIFIDALKDIVLNKSKEAGWA